MKQNILRKLMLIVVLLTGSHAFSHDFEVGGIYYNITSTSRVEVTYRGDYYDSYSNEYSGQVIIPETVTYNRTTYSVTSIGEYAFSGCSGLTSVTIGNSVTSIGGWAFYNCSGLTSVNISDLEAWCKIDFSGSASNPLTYAYNLYLNGELLTNIEIPNSITEIKKYAFYKCSRLTSVTIPESVTSIGSSAFENCDGLTSVTIPNSVTSIGDYAFEECSDLTSVIIGNSVTSIGSSAFKDCSGLESIIVESGNTKYDSRNNCNAIIETSTNTLIAGCINTTIPNSVTSIGDYAFEECRGLTSVTIPNSVTSIGNGAFRDCIRLTSVIIGNSVTSIGSSAFDDCSGLTSVTIPNSVTSIGEWAFYYCI